MQFKKFSIFVKPRVRKMNQEGGSFGMSYFPTIMKVFTYLLNEWNVNNVILNSKEYVDEFVGVTFFSENDVGYFISGWDKSNLLYRAMEVSHRIEATVGPAIFQGGDLPNNFKEMACRVDVRFYAKGTNQIFFFSFGIMQDCKVVFLQYFG